MEEKGNEKKGEIWRNTKKMTISISNKEEKEHGLTNGQSNL